MNLFPLRILAAQAGETQPAGHFDWQKWLGAYKAEYLISASAVFVLTLLAGWLLVRIFRAVLERHRLVRPLRLGVLALAIYLMMFVWHPKLMVDPLDYGAIALHKAFIAAMLFVALRLLDRLLIVPVLTRGGKASLPRFVHQIVLLVLYAFALLGFCSWAFSLNIDKFLAGSAVLSIVLGLALQETLGNFFSGMVMQASSPFVPGDWIECGGIEGRVVDMTWRSVTLHTLDDNYVLIPNSLIAKERIVNYHNPTRATARHVRVGLDYALAPNDARAVLLQAAAETPGVLAQPAPRVFLEEYADSAIVYRIKFWIDRPQEHPVIENAVRTNTWYRLKQAGYNIPFPIRTVEYVNLERKEARRRQHEHAARAAVLRDIRLLTGLSEEQREMLAEDAREVVLAAGQILFQQDHPGDSFFILQHGQVESSLTLPDGKILALGQLGPGDFFGELSALTGQPRPVTIRAASDITCIEITRQHLHALFIADPALMNTISEVVAQRTAERDAKIHAAGAPATAESKAPTAPTVLDRMKRVFGKLHVEVGKVGRFTTAW